MRYSTYSLYSQKFNCFIYKIKDPVTVTKTVMSFFNSMNFITFIVVQWSSQPKVMWFPLCFLTTKLVRCPWCAADENGKWYGFLLRKILSLWRGYRERHAHIHICQTIKYSLLKPGFLYLPIFSRDLWFQKIDMRNQKTGSANKP